jgi:transcriptional regulator with XRE-family HTH domain
MREDGGMAAGTTSSTLVRRQLGRRLRALREAAGKTREDVAATRLLSRSKLEMIEHGRVRVRPADVRELGLLYGADPDDIEIMREMALATDQQSYWQEFSDHFVKGFETYLDLESAACECWAFEPALVHGLLQTREYATAIERSTSIHALDEKTVRGHVQIRMHRRRLLSRDEDPLRLQVVLGETALRLAVGDPEVMAAQRRELLALDGRGNVDIRVLPDAAGPHPGFRGGFVILTFDDPANPSLAYIETNMGARYTEDAVQVTRHREIFEVLLARSVPIKEFAP